MGRNRVLSFMSQLRDSQKGPTSYAPPATNVSPTSLDDKSVLRKEQPATTTVPRNSHQTGRPVTPPQQQYAPTRRSPQAQGRTGHGRDRASSRPQSMLQTYQPPLMELSSDTIPELQPIFTYLNSHSNKLYQEGYFLKLDDQNTQGKQNSDRTWTECFAQLVGTILSLWDAAELDAIGADGQGEVLPKFINLTDASIKMIESLPTQSSDGRPLQNVLSISTAARNRYLLHFNSHHSMIQWTAAIRLALFEHTLLQESYTGALIAGKGKTLNNISIIMERNRVKHEDWARVRFGAGTPWRRCWCVISPPDEKEFQKMQKEYKKKSVYQRGRPPLLKGTVKFYESKKTKKVQPIATITNAYAAYAIYPQSKPLIEASTLVKVEGTIVLHSSPVTVNEGFVFVMPEVHPAVSGFEMLLRWLFPVFDTFGLYGRPGRLIAETLDARSLMFAMPRERYLSYLDNLDVANLVLTEGSQNWREEEWRIKLKEITARRMAAIASGGGGSQVGSRVNSHRAHRNSLPSKPRVSFGDGGSDRSTSSVNFAPGPSEAQLGGPLRTDSAPPAVAGFEPPRTPHKRASSDTRAFDRLKNLSNSQIDHGYESAPTPPPHKMGVATALHERSSRPSTATNSDVPSSEDENLPVTPIRGVKHTREVSVGPVMPPPAFSHSPNAKPSLIPYHSPELRRANSRMSSATLSQLAGANSSAGTAAAGAAAAWSGAEKARGGDNRLNSSERLAEIPRKAIPEHESVPRDRPLPPVPQESTAKVLKPIDTQLAAHAAHPVQKAASSQESPMQQSPVSAITRKPVPNSTPSGTPSSEINALGTAALGTQPAQAAVAQSQLEGTPLDRVESLGSHYDDAVSNPSPKYESPTRRSVDRPRAGVMRTVGSTANAIRVGDIEYSNSDANPSGSTILNIDFGPTLNYASNRLPTRTQSPTKATHVQQIQHSRQHSRSPSKLAISQTPSPPRSTPQNIDTGPRTVAWQPGMGSIGSPSSGGTLSPEEFVRERAVVASSPIYTHHRANSGYRSATPPLNRDRSSEFYAQSHSRHSSTDILQRPSSRGASTVFNYSHSRAGSFDMLQRPPSRGAMTVLGSGPEPSGHLSAREQEHLSRISGAPLVSIHQRQESPHAGLVGEIDNLERERREMRHGLSTHAAHMQMRSQYDPFVQQPQQPQQQQHMAYQYPQYPQQHWPTGQSASVSYLPLDQPNQVQYRAPPVPQHHPQQQYYGQQQ